MKLSQFIPEIKIQPNEKIDTNDKLLFFVNKNKEKVVKKLVEVHKHLYDFHYNEDDIKTMIEIPVKLQKGIVVLDDGESYHIGLSINKINGFDNEININGIKIYVY